LASHDDKCTRPEPQELTDATELASDDGSQTSRVLGFGRDPAHCLEKRTFAITYDRFLQPRDTVERGDVIHGKSDQRQKSLEVEWAARFVTNSARIDRSTGLAEHVEQLFFVKRFPPRMRAYQKGHEKQWPTNESDDTIDCAGCRA
jgi:hypothetical protein